MRLISLNIWGGHVKAPLLDFIETQQAIDFFCLQEVYHQAKDKTSEDDREVSLNIFAEISAKLPEHNGFFKPVVDDAYGLAAFIHKRFQVRQEGVVIIHHNPDYAGRGAAHSRILQWLECSLDNQPFVVVNVHGLWNGMGKTDTPSRIRQSQKVKQFVDSLAMPVVLCGDFNLRPDTESLRIVEEGMNNLIHAYEIISTRTHLYPKPEKFADYIFTSPEVGIKHFAVLEDVVSDHAPLLLDFELAPI
jgi:endonuclease/exonuclease/phosphatase family metal-dependent hydrolase